LRRALARENRILYSENVRSANRFAALLAFAAAVALIHAAGRPRIACADEWELGRATYLSRCARCHGEDGSDTTYPEIRPLEGIGRRLTREQIRARLHSKAAGPKLVLIRGETFTAEEVEALISYVAEL